MAIKKKEKPASEEDNVLERYSKAHYAEQLYSQDPHSANLRDILADLEGKDKLAYAKIPERAISRKIEAQLKKREEEITEKITYEWLLKNKNIDQIFPLLLTLPELKDKNKYGKIAEAVKNLQDARNEAQEKGKEEYIKDFYNKKIKEAKTKGDEAIEFANLYTAVSTSENVDEAYKGIVISLQYEIKQELKKVGGKETPKKKK